MTVPFAADFGLVGGRCPAGCAGPVCSGADLGVPNADVGVLGADVGVLSADVGEAVRQGWQSGR